MRKLITFNNVTLDGYFTDKNGDMSWAHQLASDTEWQAFVEGNAKGGGVLLFGRVTYDMMAGYWPTPLAAKQNPVVAEQMNTRSKVVFSRTLEKAAWNNTRLIKEDAAGAVRTLKNEPGPGLVILGSGSIVSQLAQEELIDEYHVVVHPIVLGSGRTLFEGVTAKLNLKLTKSRTFGNGCVSLSYEPRG
jgi:dihydrofolate reductase